MADHRTYGSHDDEVERAVKAHGYVAAFDVRRQANPTFAPSVMRHRAQVWRRPLRRRAPATDADRGVRVDGIVNDFSAGALIGAIEANLVEFHVHLGRWPEISVHDDPDRLWTVSRRPFSLCNVVLRVRFGGLDLAGQVDRALAPLPGAPRQRDVEARPLHCAG